MYNECLNCEPVNVVGVQVAVLLRSSVLTWQQKVHAKSMKTATSNAVLFQ